MSSSHIFVSALNDTGGGLLARLLDGHPELLVFPFEMQLGTTGARRGFDDWFPAKYRWPQLPATPEAFFDAFPNEEILAAQRGDQKFRGFGLDIDISRWKTAFERELDGASERGKVVSIWLRSFFGAWRDAPPNRPSRTVVAHCPILALDWDLIRLDLPDARMVHVVRNPCATFVDTKKRRPGMSAEGFARRWSVVNTIAAWHATRYPAQFRLLSYSELVRSRKDAMVDLASWLGIEFDDALLTPTWNGKVLQAMGPFGGVPEISEDYERAQVDVLSARDRASLETLTAGARVLLSLGDEPSAQTSGSPENFADPATNLSLSAIATREIPAPLEFETLGDFWGLLDELDVALLVTREYEHLLVLLGGNSGQPWQSAMPIPHPSGAFVEPGNGAFVVSSTRTPNQLFWFDRLSDDAWERETVPTVAQAEDGTLFLPKSSRVLPGSFYIHDVVIAGGDVHVSVTGHNFVARIDPKSGWERVWWPRLLDVLGRHAFESNVLQLNSIGLGPSGIADGFFTAFSEKTEGTKPWKEGYGPRGRGVAFSARTRDVVLRGLTCPHSATVHDGTLWLCDSGFGSVGHVSTNGDAPDQNSFVAAAQLSGFTRGLAFAGHYAVVGLSKVIPRYEPYAPGLEPSASRCGLAIIDARTGEIAAQLWWPQGLQIYEVQTLSGIRRPMLPSVHARTGIAHLSFLG